MPKPTTAQRAQVLLHAYRAELRRLYGDERADEMQLSYSHGWFYVTRHMVWTPPYRRAEFEHMINVLKSRQPSNRHDRTPDGGDPPDA